MSKTIPACPCCMKGGCPTNDTCDDKCQGIYTAAILFPAPYAFASNGALAMLGEGCTWGASYFPDGGIVNVNLYCLHGKWYVHVFVCLLNPTDGNYEECDYTSAGRAMVPPNNCPPTGAYMMGAGVNELPGVPGFDVCGGAPTVTLS